MPSVMEYKFSGPAIVKAVQESVDTRTNIKFFRDTDQAGNIIRIGYFLSARDTDEPVSTLRYIPLDEVIITTVPSNEGVVGTGRLEVGFNHSKKHEKHFSVLFPIGGVEFRLRCIFRIERDGNRNFVIMLDEKVSQKGILSWKAVSRFDCAHNFIHKDILDSRGRNTVEKKKIPVQDKTKAIKFIINEVIQELKIQQIISLKNRRISKVTENTIILDIRKAEKLITKLFKSPKFFSQLKSSMVAFADEQGPILVSR